MSINPNPWERQKRETVKAYDAFCALRDTPPDQRSIPKCVQALYGGGRKSAKVRQWQKWSKRYN